VSAELPRSQAELSSRFGYFAASAPTSTRQGRLLYFAGYLATKFRRGIRSPTLPLNKVLCSELKHQTRAFDNDVRANLPSGRDELTTWWTNRGVPPKTPGYHFNVIGFATLILYMGICYKVTRYLRPPYSFYPSYRNPTLWRTPNIRPTRGLDILWDDRRNVSKVVEFSRGTGVREFI
jgi:hypothetical protein